MNSYFFLFSLFVLIDRGLLAALCPFYGSPCECEQYDPPRRNHLISVICSFGQNQPLPVFNGDDQQYIVEGALTLQGFVGNVSSGPFRVFKTIETLKLEVEHRQKTEWNDDALNGVAVSHLITFGIYPMFPIPETLLRNSGRYLQSLTVGMPDGLLTEAQLIDSASIDRLTALELLSINSVPIQCTEDAFAKSPVQRLVTRQTDMIKLPSTILSKMKRLHTLDLNEKRLQLEESQFANLTELKQLAISGIDASILNLVKVFDRIDKQLKSLEMSNTHLTDIPSLLLQSTTALESLDLSYNNIHHLRLDSFPENSKLKTINLYDNPVMSVAPPASPRLQSVSTLILSKTMLSTFDLSALYGMDQLQKLNIGSSQTFSLVISDVEKVPKNIEELSITDYDVELDNELDSYMTNISIRLVLKLDIANMHCTGDLAWLASYYKCTNRVVIDRCSCGANQPDLNEFLTGIAPDICPATPAPLSGSSGLSAIALAPITILLLVTRIVQGFGLSM